jgi:hypothetical protein
MNLKAVQGAGLAVLAILSVDLAIEPSKVIP